MRLMLMIVVCLGILVMPFVLKAADNQEEPKGYFETVAVPVKTISIGLVAAVGAGPDAQDRSGKSIYIFPQAVSSPQLFCIRIDPDTGMCESFYTGTPGKRPRGVGGRSSDNDGWSYGDWDTMEYRFNPRTGALQCLEDVGLRWNFKTNRAEKISEQETKTGGGANNKNLSSGSYLTALLKDLFGLGVVFAQGSTKEAPWKILTFAPAPDGKQWTLRSNTSNTLWMREEEPFAHLWVYDTVTGEEKDLGVVPERKWYQYPMGPTVGPNGKLYFGLVPADPDIVVYDPKTGKQKSMLPQEYRKFPAWISNATDSKGNLYFLLYPGKPGLQPLLTFRVQDDDTLVSIPLKEFPGYDGREDFPYDYAMPTCTLGDGRVVSFVTTSGNSGPGGLEVKDRLIRISDPKTGKERILHYDYAGVPQELFGNPVKGPDGKIYGTSGGHLYRYDPVTGKSEEIGNTIGLYGQVYTTVFSRGKLYTLYYGNGGLGVYDPAKPWRYGKDKDANPRDVGLQGGAGGNRFFDYTIGADENIYAVSCPVNGYLGGSLLRIDTKTDTTKYWWNEVVHNQMLVSITNDPDKKHLWIGSGPGSVSIYDPEQKEAKLALWDMNEEKKIFECVPIPGMLVPKILFTAPNGLIYGLGIMGEVKGTQQYRREGIMFVWDPKKREVIHQVKIPMPLYESGHSLGLGEDGNIYGLVSDGVCMIDPKDNSFKMLAKWEHGDLRGGPFVDGKNLYFISGSSLVRFVLP